jgi:hypothetical protein
VRVATGSMTRQLQVLLLFVAATLRQVSGYIKDDGSGAGNESYFKPYDQGFVGVYGEPSNFLRERINEGSFENPAKELIYEDVFAIQTCPGMVGPFVDGSFFCTAKEYGYCDRRSGVCFCNIGYQGVDCSECTPSYFKVGYLCYPKKTCPNDCSGSGVCDYWTGTCTCYPHRVGADCGTLLCKSFNELCEACSITTCLRCPDGYYLDAEAQCQSCYDFDPRCSGCTLDLGCTLCSDPLLTSVRRSGYRADDPRVPVEEDTRESSITIPFGSKSPEAFADAEAFVVTDTGSALNEKAIACHQGYNNDEHFHCEKTPASHVVCGHKGVFSFNYPNYEVSETSRFFRVSVRRSGGGFGDVLVNYFIKHFTTEDNDLSATAPYTTSQTLYFDEGVVERSFLVSILDDNVVEENEVFQIVLELPEGGGSIGSQFRTNITIIDDDLELLSPIFTHPLDTKITAVANVPFQVNVQAVAASGVKSVVGGERFLAVVENDVATWASSTEIYRSDGQRHAPRTLCSVSDNGNGVYTVNGLMKEQGVYQLRIWHAFPLGLKGTYHRDAFMENVALERIDRFVNFTWGTGRLLPRGADYISIRWTGVLRADTTDQYHLRIDADEHARLWVDGNLLIDHWHEQRADLEPFRTMSFEKDALYEVVMEYREVRGDAFARLEWTSASDYTYFQNNLNDTDYRNSSFEVIPPENMYSLYEIGSSPVEVTVTSGDTDAEYTECTGDGLFTATALKTSDFRFCPRDSFLNYRDDVDDFFLQSELFNVTLTLLDDLAHAGQGVEVIWPVVTYNTADHCFDAKYTPERAGLYELNILYHEWHGEAGTHVAGSPFQVTVSPGRMNGPYSEVFDLPSPLLAEAGLCYDFTIISEDGSHNLLLKGGEDIQIYMFRASFFNDEAEESISTEVYDPDVDVVRYGSVTDLGNGNYTGTVCPIVTGWYEIHILLNGQGVSNLPFKIQTRQNSQGDASGADLGSSFRGQYIHRSPYHSYVSNSEASAINSVVEVSGSLDGCTVGVLASFMVTLKDSWKNIVRSYPISPPEVKISMLHAPDVESVQYNLGNGSHKIDFVPTYAGTNLVQVLVNNAPIEGSPFTVDIIDGVASQNHTYAVGPGLNVGTTGFISAFLVYAMDLDGNPKTDYNDTYSYMTSGSENVSGVLYPCLGNDESALYCGSAEPVGGLYYTFFEPTKTGYLTIQVFLDDSTGSHELWNSPFIPRIHPGLPKAENTDIWGTIHNSTVGIESIVQIHLRDKYGNKLEEGGENVELLLGGVAGDWGTIQPWGTLPGLQDMYYYAGHYGPYPDVYGTWIDHGDGSYTCSYTLFTTGQYVTRLALAEQGLNATFFNDSSFGYLVDMDDNMDAWDSTRDGFPVNMGSSISWTGDLGRRPAGRVIGEGTYFHRFKSDVVDKINFDLRFHNDSLNGALHAGRNDTLLNTLFPVSEKFRGDYWSVRYTGLITPTKAETYNFTLLGDPESIVTLRIGGLGAHTNGSAPGEVVATLQPSRNVASGQYTFTDTKMREFVLEYQHTTGPSTYLSLLWESPSTPQAIVPSSAFHHWRNMSHFNLTGNPNKLCPHCSTAYGDALTKATTGHVHSFVVYGRDDYGNLKQVGGDVPSMVAVGPNGVAFRGIVTDYGNSTYLVEYHPTQAGMHRMYVTIGCCPAHPNIGISREIELMRDLLVMDAPFLLDVSPAEVFASRTVATGKSLVSAEAGQVHSFDILYRDLHNNPTKALTDEEKDNLQIIVEFREMEYGNTVLNFVEEWKDVRDTLARISYNLTTAGEYLVDVKLYNDEHIVGSPFRLTIRPSKAAASSTVVRGLGKRDATVGHTALFEITLKDIYNNTCFNGGDNLHIRLHGSHRREDRDQVITPVCVDIQDGTYLCSYTPTIPGSYHLRIHLLESPMDHPGGSGLLAKYYTDSEAVLFHGSSDSAGKPSPLLTRTDKNIDFSWPGGFELAVKPGDDVNHMTDAFQSRTFTSDDFYSGIHISWEGFVVAPISTNFVFKAPASNFNMSIYIDNVLVYDTLENELGKPTTYSSVVYDSTFSVPLLAGCVYDIRVIAHRHPHNRGLQSSFIQLTWSTPTVRTTVIPSFFLYEKSTEVAYSPFPVTVSDDQ